MTGGTRIVAIGTASQEAEADSFNQAAPEDTPLTLSDDYELDEEPHKSAADVAIPAFAVVAAMAWSAFFIRANIDAMMAGATAQQWVRWIVDGSVPLLLICTMWLLVMRSSRREAGRFGDIARSLRRESATLGTTLSTVNQELSLAREFIASQSRDLESLGRVAAERLSQNADRLQDLVRDNGAQVNAIATVSASALENMDRLRGQLPVIASSAKDVTNNIANAGRVAHSQIEEMVGGFKRINEFGQASEKQVFALRENVDAAIGTFGQSIDHIEQQVNVRFAELTSQNSDLRTQLESHEIEALASIRNRARALGDELAETRQQLDGHEAESLTSLRSRLAALRDEGAAVTRALRESETTAIEGWRANLQHMNEDMRQAISTLDSVDRQAMDSARERLRALVEEAQRLDQNLADRNREFAVEVERREAEAAARHGAMLEEFGKQLASLDIEIAARREAQADQAKIVLDHGEGIAQHLSAFDDKLREVSAHSEQVEANVGSRLQSLASQLSGSREALAGTDSAIAQLTDSSVRLLELIQASSQHSREEIPGAIAISEERLSGLESRISAVRDAISAADQHGESLANHVITSRGNIAASLDELAALHAGLGDRAASHATTLAELRQSLASLMADTSQVADRAQGELRQAIEQLSGSAREAVSGIESMSAATISALAGRLGDESGAAIDAALRSRTAEAAGQLEQAAANAAGVSRDAAMQLRDQLAKVNELAGNLEQRVNHARQRAQEQVDNDFSRRVALITESLNSNAIDIARALSTDVTDTSWAAYLRGDRGVFTRRAVSLLDSGEARAIAGIYESDRDFREHVSHYIHDFEAMLRQLLSTRDGHALGVTLLSSDMGKLYVALAQAIERLRN